MTLEIALLLTIVGVMVVLFLTEKLPVEITAFLGLCAMLVAGYVPVKDAFTGFQSPAVITMLAIFILSAALQHTGVADSIGGRMHALVGDREVPLTVVIMVVAGVLSAFMNNIAATAVLLPAVASISRRTGINPGRLFMPLAFGAILGGTTTLVGTPPNLLVGELIKEANAGEFKLFDFTPFGVVLLGTGVLFMVTIGRRLLPAGTRQEQPALADEQPIRSYGIEERLFSIRVPEGTPLDGRTMREARLGSTLGVQVVTIFRNGSALTAPLGDLPLAGGDVLVAQGDLDALRDLLAVQGVELADEMLHHLTDASERLDAAVTRVPAGSPLVGRSPRDIRFRHRYGPIAELRRDGKRLRVALGQLPLRAGDELCIVAAAGELEASLADDDLETLETGSTVLAQLWGNLHLLRIPAGSHLHGQSLERIRLGKLVGLNVVGLLRSGEPLATISPEDVLEAGDELLVAGEPAHVQALLALGSVEIDSETPGAALESERSAVVEAIVAPRSSVAGQTLRELSFRKRYGLDVLDVWSQGKPQRTRLADHRIDFGQALLLRGPRDRIALLTRDPDWVVLAPKSDAPLRRRKAPIAIGALGVMIVLVIAGWFPIQAAAFIAATLVLLLGAVSMEEAYRAIEWKAIFLVAAILPAGLAMEQTGAAKLVAEVVVTPAGELGPYVLLAALMILSSMLSQGLDGAPAVVLMTPVVLRAAEQLGLSPAPLLMGVGLAASAAFMTPFSHKANLLVMGAGGYRVMDFVRVGSILTVIVLAILTLMIPWVMPF